jgi:hypothetical protein
MDVGDQGVRKLSIRMHAVTASDTRPRRVEEAGRL